MRRSLPVLAVLALPLALAACGGGGGGGSTAQTTTPTTTTAAAKPHTVKSVTIRVTSIVTSTKAHQQTKSVTTAGDKVEFKDVLLNATSQFGKKKNERVGSDQGTMTFTSKTTARLDGTASLPDGNIRFSGDVTVLSDSSITVPVVGGTGKYKNASGTLHVGAGKKSSPNTYHLLLEGVIPGPVA